MNGPTHRLVAGAAVGIVMANSESKAGTATVKPILGGIAAACFTNLPDLIEPATSPNHRGFFHSLTFATLVGLALHELWRWDPQTDAERFWKGAAQLAAAGYLIHLALDFTTPKSLPLVGRI